MEQKITVVNFVRKTEGSEPQLCPPLEPGQTIEGIPAGGSVEGIGIAISWQNGALGRGAERIEPNGAFVEGVIQAAASRLEFYQASKFNCTENAVALSYLKDALAVLNSRTKKREERMVEGTHQV